MITVEVSDYLGGRTYLTCWTIFTSIFKTKEGSIYIPGEGA